MVYWVIDLPIISKCRMGHCMKTRIFRCLYVWIVFWISLIFRHIHQYCCLNILEYYGYSSFEYVGIKPFSYSEIRICSNTIAKLVFNSIVNVCCVKLIDVYQRIKIRHNCTFLCSLSSYFYPLLLKFVIAISKFAVHDLIHLQSYDMSSVIHHFSSCFMRTSLRLQITMFDAVS